MRALETGGGRGIGAAIARALASDGWQVGVAARSGAQAQAVASGVGRMWGQGGVSDRASGKRRGAGANDVDLLVDNAGVSEGHARGASWEIDPDEWWRIYEVNVLGVHLCCRAVVPGMLERGGGRILITGSGAAYLPASGSSSTAYPSSKGGGLPLRRDARRGARRADTRFLLQPGARAHRDDRGDVLRRRALDAAGAGARARPQARDGPVRRARRPLPARRARRRRRPARAHRRGARAGSERDPAQEVIKGLDD